MNRLSKLVLLNLFYWPCSIMDSTRVSEAPNPSSILGEATKPFNEVEGLCYLRGSQASLNL